MTRQWALAAAAAVVSLALPAPAFGHAERETHYPDHREGSVPEPRTDETPLVVCKEDSEQRIRDSDMSNGLKESNLALVPACRFRHIQEAVNAAANNDVIKVLPGTYLEEPSRATSSECPAAAMTGGGLLGTGISAEGEQASSYEFQRICPNAQNLIAIVGDGPDEGRQCDLKCNIQVEGTARRSDVLIQGDRKKLNVIRADRADGIFLRNFTIEYSDFNNIYALETNGFRFEDIESRYSREYGFLSFSSDNGLYKNLEAYGAGDSGVYPGSGPEGHCSRYGIEITGVDSHDNTIGSSGTAGNGTYFHDNKFHDNSAGVTTDSFASGHPGMPQDCSKWEDNEIYSNNADLFNAERDEYCKQPYEQRDPKIVCPTFQVPVGTGMLIAGGNGNIVRRNRIWDNWRSGTRLMWVPAAARGETDPTKTYDTSHDNAFEDNVMGISPGGASDPNRQDFWWDEEGSGNCWSGNVAFNGKKPKSDPDPLPTCPNTSPFSPGNPEKQASQATCATWDPQTNTDPPGCDWFTVPPEPKADKPKRR